MLGSHFGHGQSWATFMSIMVQGPGSPGHGDGCRIFPSLYTQQEAKVVSSATAVFSPCLVTLLSSGEDSAFFSDGEVSFGLGQEKIDAALARQPVWPMAVVNAWV